MISMDKIILHCDLNNFFASVSLLGNQTLKELPVAVCGSKEDRRGIVLAKNEIAKSFGVKTAETIWQAQKKCPELVILPPEYKKYEEYSAAAQRIYAKYTDKIEPFGIDECWLDVTGSTMLFGSGAEIAEKIKRDIKSELGITASIGVSFNKVFAKLGSDMKKPDAVTIINRENFKTKVWPLPVADMLFAGRRTVQKLNEVGVFTIGDLANANDETLKKALGKNGMELKLYALGADNSPVARMNAHRIPKSIGRSVTYGHDFKNNDEVWQTFLKLSEEIAAQLRKEGLFASAVQVHTRDTDLVVKEFSFTFSTPTDIAISLAEKAMHIFKENYNWLLPLRSVGFRAINLKKEWIAVQQDIFIKSSEQIKKEKIEDSIFSIRKKYGDNSLKRATTLKK